MVGWGAFPFIPQPFPPPKKKKVNKDQEIKGKRTCTATGKIRLGMGAQQRLGSLGDRCGKDHHHRHQHEAQMNGSTERREEKGVTQPYTTVVSLHRATIKSR